MTLEQEFARELRKTKLRTAILTAVEAAGVITVAAIAPNALSVIGKVQKKWTAMNMRSAVGRLADKGLLEFDKGKVRLTATGERYLARARLKVARPLRWDKRWRVIIFDIPERRAPLRQKLRESLEQIGFIRLQNSVWVFPYDCEELIALLKAEYRVGKDVLYMIVDKIENDRPIRARFGL